MAFSDIENSEKLDIINIAIVENDQFKSDNVLKEAFKALSDEQNEDRLFSTKYTSEDEAKKLLDDGEITGYLLVTENTPKVVVSTSGINETVFKYAVEEIVRNKRNIGECF